jgi:hypothetical protein
MNPAERLSALDEKQRYDLHQNDSAGHRVFFEPLIKHIEEFFKHTERPLLSLDYGCGPVPVLSSLLLQKGFQPANYDLFYCPDQDQLRKTYHLVTSTEVWEHYHDPRADIERSLKCLKMGGLLAVMTSSHKGEASFHDWHYRRDLTHTTFFSEKTMKWISQHFRLKAVVSKSPYWIFQKEPS